MDERLLRLRSPLYPSAEELERQLELEAAAATAVERLKWLFFHQETLRLAF